MTGANEHAPESDEDGDAAAGSESSEGAGYRLRYDRPAPTVYPRLVTDVRPVGGRLRSVPEDFQVEEIPLYSCSGRG
ncbi:MAG: tRNA pseudouridine(13) synthase TruD, partial [Actinobacteria bacterium]|nr:tRNA pseudouridine(13) synthase TruD [Actinomycetota bacterium]